LIAVVLMTQARNKRRETWAGGALSRLSEEDNDDDDTDDLLPSLGVRARHTGKPLPRQYFILIFTVTFMLAGRLPGADGEL